MLIAHTSREASSCQYLFARLVLASVLIGRRFVVQAHDVRAHDAQLCAIDVEERPPRLWLEWERRAGWNSERGEVDGGGRNDVRRKEDVDRCLEAVRATCQSIEPPASSPD